MEKNQDTTKPSTNSPSGKTELNLIGHEISGCVILEKISRGGMGTVFKAKHKALNRIVCIKILSPNLAKDKKAVGLFLTEARAVAELDHQNIVQVYNVGKEKGLYFIVMSFIDGEPLSSIVRKRPNLPIGFVIDTFIGVLEGLQAAHQKGIVHRDIKPSNILITKNLQPKIVDFGIAKKVDQEKGFTKTTELAGTAYFLSPEQAAGKEIDVRADLYSLGASMFYVLTGKYPFTGKNSMEIIQKHISEPVPDMNLYRKGIPGWVVQAIQKLMEKNPDDRFQSAADALAFFQKGRADQIINTTKNINIDEEVGFTLGIEDIKESPRNNARVSKAQGEVLPKLDESKEEVKKMDSNLHMKNNNVKMNSLESISDNKTDNYIKERKNELKRLSSITNKSVDPSGIFSLKKNSFLVKAFFNTIIATLILIAGVICFLKLGMICSTVIGKEDGLFSYFIQPWSSTMAPGQLMWGIICGAYIVILLIVSRIELLSKISIYALILSLVAYLLGVAGLAALGSPVGDLTTYSYLLVLSFLFIFMAIYIDDCDIFPLFYRVLTVILFVFSIITLYHFFAPSEFVSGEMTTPLLYALIFTLIALVLMPFMRDNLMIRMATMVILAFSVISVWLYQGAGNAYAILNKMPKQALTEYEVDKTGLSEEALRLLENSQLNEYQILQSYDDLINLEPSQRRHVFIERLKKNYSIENKERIESLVWDFALTESFLRLRYYHKAQNMLFFVLIMGVMYGIFMFILKMLMYREERWNLI
ncbi:MAG: protein kinase [Elusimicrobiaceae bacterium]|nr:protein kinase [Elusimicrobiaceae bacterium]